MITTPITPADRARLAANLWWAVADCERACEEVLEAIRVHPFLAEADDLDDWPLVQLKCVAPDLRAIAKRLDPNVPAVEDERTALARRNGELVYERNALAAEVERLRAQHERDQLDLGYAPENAFHELTKDGIEFYEVNEGGEIDDGRKRRIVFCSDPGDSSVGIQASAWWQAEKSYFNPPAAQPEPRVVIADGDQAVRVTMTPEGSEE